MRLGMIALLIRLHYTRSLIYFLPYFLSITTNSKDLECSIHFVYDNSNCWGSVHNYLIESQN